MLRAYALFFRLGEKFTTVILWESTSRLNPEQHARGSVGATGLRLALMFLMFYLHL